ncbi:MAG: exodeoxyribonuclease V subunit gamma [Desulfocapsaceae bacterium]|nr:exodeoxyribonuclease V subunit gamma [Desulfocapsaceae bacterium]
MFYLHISNRTENLLSHLAEVIRAGGRPHPFDREVFLIQSQGIERMISQAMAAAFRSWCNFEYLLPLAFLTDIAGRLGVQSMPDSFDRGILVWRIEALLHDLPDEVYGPLRGYMQGQGPGLKRFQLACRLADVFDQYQIWRPDMLAGWDAGRPSTTHPSELWQMALWQRLARGAEGTPHRGFMLRQVIAGLSREGDFAGLLPGRISVFGLHIMPPLFLDYLRALAGHCDVHLYLLSPCRHYWGDIENRRKQLKTRLSLLEKGLAAEAAASVENRDRHPLLASLGWQGRDFQEMLLNSVDFELEFKSFEDPAAAGSVPTLLHRLQSDLLRDVVDRDSPPVDDGSLVLACCHSRLREVQVLKDHILEKLHREPSLELRQIIVMAPDIQDYAPLIPAVFDDIQHSIADRSLRGQNGTVGAFISFLSLFDGRFSWVEVLDLLKNEAVFPHFDLSVADLETLQHWVTDAGIRWGLSGGQRREMGLPDFSENSWSAGLERLLMGYAIDSDGFVDGILPYTAIEGAEARALGGLCRFIGILDQARGDFRHGRSLSQWSALLLDLAGLLFGTGEDEDLLELRQMLLALDEAYGRFHGDAVDIQVVRAWIEQTAREKKASSGFLRGSLTFCSMLPMRSIPFRLVCLLGLNDGEFPRNDLYATFNLMAPPRSRPGDRSFRLDDRYQFLEAVLAARDSFYVSFVGRSIRSNEAIPPSVVVTELLDFLKDAYGIENPVVEHPLHPFSRRYFSGEQERLFSYSRHYCETAARFQHPSPSAGSWWSGELAPVSQQISVRDLLAFFAHPQRWFVRNCLGIRLEHDQDLPEDREPFAVMGLTAYQAEQRMVDHCLEGGDPQELLRRLGAEGRWTQAMPGQLAFAEKYHELKGFAGKIAGLGMGSRIADRLIDCEAGGHRLVGSLSNIYEGGILLARYADLKAKDLLAGWLHHLLLEQAQGQACSTRVLGRDGLIGFSGRAAVQGPSLDRMVELFVQGSGRPSPLLVEPGLRYVRQAQAARATTPPLAKACAYLREQLDSGYEPEWALLYGNMEAEDILGGDFRELCLEIISPLWSRPDVL